MRAMAGDDSRANSAETKLARGELLEGSGPSFGQPHDKIMVGIVLE